MSMSESKHRLASEESRSKISWPVTIVTVWVIIEAALPAIVFLILFVVWVALPARPGEVNLGSKIRQEWLIPIIVITAFVLIVFAGIIGFAAVLDWIIG